MTITLLLQKSHHSPLRPDGWSGAPGEAEWVGQLCQKIVERLGPSGISWAITDGDLGIDPHDAQPGGDAVIAARHPELTRTYDVVLSVHYDADVYRNPDGSHVGGWFWDRAAADPRAADSDRWGAIFQRRYQALPGAPAFHPERRNPNTSNYYLWRLVGAFPQLIVEHGVGAFGAPDYGWLRANLDQIAQTHVDALMEFLGVVAPAPVPFDPRFAISGPSTLAFYKVVDGLRRANPQAPLEVVTLYQSLAPQLGFRAEVALAQSRKETGDYLFRDRAKADWHNPVGLGVGASSGAIDCRFETWEKGIRAGLGHLYAYYASVGSGHVSGFCDLDPRHFPHRGYPNDVRQLNGRWAVPGTDYGESIIAIVEGP